jgi:hypothetical protein
MNIPPAAIPDRCELPTGDAKLMEFDKNHTNYNGATIDIFNGWTIFCFFVPIFVKSTKSWHPDGMARSWLADVFNTILVCGYRYPVQKARPE